MTKKNSLLATAICLAFTWVVIMGAYASQIRKHGVTAIVMDEEAPTSCSSSSSGGNEE